MKDATITPSTRIRLDVVVSFIGVIFALAAVYHGLTQQIHDLKKDAWTRSEMQFYIDTLRAANKDNPIDIPPLPEKSDSRRFQDPIALSDREELIKK